MTAATVTINGTRLGEYRGGYTPFSFELTPHIDWDGENVLAVEVDSSERADIPPFGGQIDYLTFGGIYREVELRVVPETFIANVFAKPVDVLSRQRRVDVQCFLDSGATSSGTLRLEVELRDGDQVLAAAQQDVAPGTTEVALTLQNLGAHRTLGSRPSASVPGRDTACCRTIRVSTTYSTRIGFREARFTPQGFQSERSAYQTARPQSPPDLPIRRPGDAGTRAAS